MNEQSTLNQFTLYIPIEISSDSNLNLSEMRVLATIKALDKDKKCFATNSYMAECFGISTRHVSRVISSLEKKGYILVENKNSFKRTIKVQTKLQAASITVNASFLYVVVNMPKKKYIERIILELRLIIENIDILQRIFSYAICLIKRVKIQKLLFEIEICVYRAASMEQP